MRGTNLLATVALVLFLAPSAWADPAAEAKAAEAVRVMLNGSGKAIDGCVDAYLTEYPTAQGTASVTVTLAETGRVTRTDVKTVLDGARNLRLCLEWIGKAWVFPKPRRENVEITLQITVQKDVKFYIPAPGEKPPEVVGKRPKGFIQMLPGDWAFQAGAREDEE